MEGTTETGTAIRKIDRLARMIIAEGPLGALSAFMDKIPRKGEKEL